MKNIRYGKACRNAIRKTLAYSAVFKYPLSFHQLGTYLISNTKFGNKQLSKELNSLIKLNIVKEHNGLFYLSNIEPVDRQERIQQSKEILDLNSPVFKVLGTIPWVRLIAVTGSAAAYNADKESDLDICIVTSRNRVWITRAFCVLLLKLMNKYPQSDGENGKVCANLYMDEKAIEWDKSKRNIYIAHEIVRMQPVLEKQHTYFTFLKANSWVKEYFANFASVDNAEAQRITEPDSIAVDFIEKILMNIQTKHMRNKITTEEIGPHLIHFNKNDKSSSILRSFSKNIKNPH